MSGRMVAAGMQGFLVLRCVFFFSFINRILILCILLYRVNTPSSSTFSWSADDKQVMGHGVGCKMAHTARQWVPGVLAWGRAAADGSCVP